MTSEILFVEYYAYRAVEVYVVSGVGKLSVSACFVYADFVAVAACAQQVASVGCYGEIARVYAGRLVSCLFQFAGVLVYPEYRYSVVFCAVAGIKELPVRRYVYVRAAASSGLVAGGCLYVP